jgi:hypothetical protein
LWRKRYRPHNDFFGEYLLNCRFFMHSMLSRFNFSSFAPQLKTSCMAMLGLAQPAPMAVNDRTEDIRRLMLDELGDYGEKKFPAISRRIRYAQDIQALWYARSDVMAILANVHGETVAREKVAHISSQFKGLLPKALTQRCGPHRR